MDRSSTDINYTLSDNQIEALKAYGEVRHHEADTVLTEEGASKADFLVTLSGETHIIIETPEGPQRLGWMERGQFTGDVTVLTGQASLALVTMGKEGDVLHIPFEQFQKLLVENSSLSDIVVRTMTARRAFARDSNYGAVIVLGVAQDRMVFTARDLLSKYGVPHTWLSPDTDELARCVMVARDLEDDDLPVVIRGASKILRKPSVAEISESFGFDLIPDGACADVIVVGAGPAGLAASVYAASEGLSVLAIDAHNPGGQASTSSKIENYLGFPTGVSGQELAERAMMQAMKFGVSLAAPIKATGLEKDGENFCLSLQDGRKLNSRSIIIATGAQYRRLPIDNLERFEGRGIYYGATPMEAQLCQDTEIAIVGAGNSAGQGAVFLSGSAKTVHVLYRRADIRDTMSEYLVRRLEEIPNIILHPETEISELHGVENAEDGDDRLVSVTFKNTADGTTSKETTPFVFLFVGASPFTEWLPDAMVCDKHGFVKTGSSISAADLKEVDWPLERMPSEYETSWPRVYAVGDVQAGSVKRVASAVGQGSVVVSSVHQALSEVEAQSSKS